ncbi:hypothetical protein EUGRSUZ_B00287 [Eucalyptus grandis]|uniref:Uncharacterized protein n=2 Tax=Eucalyptus grandis TaxID=71139 RepID=A0ACC3LNS7_EUCGR|nr:hypothetical protein EUGRSUZ_B00287 [Eucalyptus grandis]
MKIEEEERRPELATASIPLASALAAKPPLLPIPHASHRALATPHPRPTIATCAGHHASTTARPPRRHYTRHRSFPSPSSTYHRLCPLSPTPSFQQRQQLVPPPLLIAATPPLPSKHRPPAQRSKPPLSSDAHNSCLPSSASAALASTPPALRLRPCQPEPSPR